MLDHNSSLPIEPYFTAELRGLGLLKKIRQDPLAFFQNLGNTHGSYAWMSLMGSPVLFLNDATAIDYIFHKGAIHYHKGKYNEGLRPLMGNGVFLSEGALWKKQRRDMAPVFAHKNFPDFTNQIVAAVEAMLERWQPKITAGEKIDLAQETPWLTFDVILRALYHEAGGDKATHIRDCLGTMLRLAEKRIWSPFALPMKWAVKLPKYARTMRFLDQVTFELIESRRQEKAYPDDLLSRLLECHGKGAEEQQLLRDNILSFMLAGQETTGNAITWAFYELARHTEARRKAVKEIDTILAGAAPVYDTAKNLDYLRQVFCEILRMYAPAWTMSRHTVTEDTVPLDDGSRLRVPKDTTVMLCAYTVHHRPAYWEDPEAFMPERFERQNIEKRPRSSWFPYGGGNRLCLGLKLAELEGMIALAMVYQKYDVQLLPGQNIRPEPIITLRPDKPVYVVLKPRCPESQKPPVAHNNRDDMDYATGPRPPVVSKCPFSSFSA